MNSYTQLIEQVRYQISADLSAGFNQTEAAFKSGIHKSIISRELRRNTGKRGMLMTFRGSDVSLKFTSVYLKKTGRLLGFFYSLNGALNK